MSQKPIVSVVMPVYNAERYLGRAVASILAQTLTDFELLIIDDGSCDRSLDRLKKYAAQDSRIRLTSRENRGIAPTRNELLAEARADLIAVMDADDIALPERLAHQVAFLEQHPEVSCLGSAYQLIDAGNRLILDCFAVPTDNDTIQQRLLAGFGVLHQPCAMFRRSLALKVGGYDDTMQMGEDIDLWLRLGEVGQLANLPMPLMQYRIHSTSISGQKATLGTAKAREACERAWKRRGIEGRFEATGQWRPVDDRNSRHAFMMQYGWWAFNSKQRGTALIYGTRALAAKPRSLDSWKLLACAAFKPFPEATLP